MSPLLKTLFGDVGNVLVVATILAVMAGVVAAGVSAIAAYVIPPLILAGIAWLAAR